MFLHVYLVSVILFSKGILALNGGIDVEGIVPYQVAIFSRDMETVPICNGVLISEWLVVTAKSCVSELPIRFVLGNVNVQELEPHEVEMNIDSPEQIYQPPQESIEVVLVQLPIPLELDSYISPIEIGNAEENQDVTVTSWGYKGGHLKQIDAKLEPTHRCDHPPLPIVFRLCTFGAACSGDTGAPLVVKDNSGSLKLVSILTAFDSKCNGSIDSYTKLMPLREWIDQVDAMVKEKMEKESGQVDVGSDSESESQEQTSAPQELEEFGTESITLEGTETPMEYHMEDGIKSGTESNDSNIFEELDTSFREGIIDDVEKVLDTTVSTTGTNSSENLNGNVIGDISNLDDLESQTDIPIPGSLSDPSEHDGTENDISPGTDIENANNINVSYPHTGAGNVVADDISVNDMSNHSDISREFISIRMEMKPPVLNQELNIIIRNSEITKYTKESVTEQSEKLAATQNQQNNNNGSAKRPIRLPIRIPLGKSSMAEPLAFQNRYSSVGIPKLQEPTRLNRRRRPFCVLYPGRFPDKRFFVNIKSDESLSNSSTTNNPIVTPSSNENEQDNQKNPVVNQASERPIYEIFSNSSFIDKRIVKPSYVATKHNIRKNPLGNHPPKKPIDAQTDGKNFTKNPPDTNVRHSSVPSFRFPVSPGNQAT